MWLHAVRAPGLKKLICSPDTDVYHIGLQLLWNEHSNFDVLVQTSPFSSLEIRYISLSALHLALNHDPDFAQASAALRPTILQTLFICSWCDYTSFFAVYGKATFLQVCFQYAHFVNASSLQLPGTLADTSYPDTEEGFHAFFRLVGAMYFKKHMSA